MQNYQDLRVWQLAAAIAKETYQVTSAFPKEERFELRAQIRSAAASGPANIAEGRARGRDREFAYFLRVALGSATELESHLFLASNVGLIAPQAYRSLAKQVAKLKRMLWLLLKTVQRPPKA